MWVSSGLYAAGTDTTACYMANFFLAMTIFPDVQRRAQEELDALLGAKVPGEPTRLPEFEDKGKLPYVEAMIKEIHRWAPAGPIGAAHVGAPEHIINDNHPQLYRMRQLRMISTTATSSRKELL
jgi:cytochrome P450